MKDIIITSLETIDAYDISTDGYLFTLDELTDAKIANTEDKTDITGKGGRKLSSIKKNKAVTVSGTNGLVSGHLLALQTGGDFAEKDDAEVKWTDYLTVSGDKATTTGKAIGTTGAEIGGVYVKEKDGSLGTEYKQAAAAATGKFAYNPANKELTFNSGDIEDGTEIIVVYKRKVKAHVLENISDQYSKKCKLYINALGEDRCGNTYKIQFFIPKADFNGNFDFEMGENQTVQAFEAESLAGSCDAGGALWRYTVIGFNNDGTVTDAA